MSLNLPKDLYSVTACMAKPQEAQQGWKRRLPKLLSISVLDAQGTSLLLLVEIGTTDTSKLHSVKALLDSGAMLRHTNL